MQRCARGETGRARGAVRLGGQSRRHPESCAPREGHVRDNEYYVVVPRGILVAARTDLRLWANDLAGRARYVRRRCQLVARNEDIVAGRSSEGGDGEG